MRTDGPVVVDVAASAAKPSAADVAAWAADQRVFVSSTMGGMDQERRATVAAVEAVGAEPVWFEGFGGRDDDAEVACLSEVASSTVYVGILGRSYGRLMKSRLSATHEERQSERQAVRYSTAMLLGSLGFLVAEVLGGPHGIAIFPLAVVGGIEAGRVIERRASREGWTRLYLHVAAPPGRLSAGLASPP